MSPNRHSCWYDHALAHTHARVAATLGCNWHTNPTSFGPTRRRGVRRGESADGAPGDVAHVRPCARQAVVEGLALAQLAPYLETAWTSTGLALFAAFVHAVSAGVVAAYFTAAYVVVGDSDYLYA